MEIQQPELKEIQDCLSTNCSILKSVPLISVYSRNPQDQQRLNRIRASALIPQQNNNLVCPVAQGTFHYTDNYNNPLPYDYIVHPVDWDYTLEAIRSIILTQLQIKSYFRQMLSTLQFLSNFNHSHPNLNLSHIGIKSENQAFVLRILNSYIGSGYKTTLEEYMLPEASFPNFNTNMADIYLLGVNGFLMHTGIFFPFAVGKRLPELLEENPDLFWQGIKDKHGFKFSEDFKRLFEGMVAVDPVDRISLQEIENSDWLNNNQNDDFADDDEF